EQRERKEVQNFVKQQLAELLDLRPEIFMVSAKLALTDKGTAGGLFKTGGSDPGGMNAVREYLHNIFSRVPPAKQKLYAQLDFVDSVTRKYTADLDKQIGLITSDTALAED